jgi:flagellar hook-associated protein 1 FlgK
MSGLFGSLNNSVKALNAQTRGIETAGRNLANVSNPDYARQRVIFGDRGTVVTTSGPQSLGLEALGIQQLRDTLLDQQVLREVSLKADLEMRQSALESAQAGLGQSIDRSTGTSSTDGGSHGIAESMSDFFNAFQSFAAKPTDVGEKQTLIQKAQILADRFQMTDERLAQVQTDMTSEITNNVDDVNRLLSTIAELNTQISRYEQNFPGGAADLRDTRQKNMEELAKLMNFESRPQPGYPGQVQLFIHDGTGSEIILVDLGSSATLALNGAATSVTATPPVGSAAVVDFKSGAIHGSFEARDTYVSGIRSELDALAHQMVVSVNGAYSASGSNFFNPAGITAGTIALNAAINSNTLVAGTGSSGDNSIAIAVGAIASTKYSIAGGDFVDGTMGQSYNKTVTDMGQTLSGVSARLEDQATIEKLVRSQRDAVAGVSLDEEMADLMKYQRAFQASSRVISTIDSLLETVVNLGR